MSRLFADGGCRIAGVPGFWFDVGFTVLKKNGQRTRPQGPFARNFRYHDGLP